MNRNNACQGWWSDWVKENPVVNEEDESEIPNEITQAYIHYQEEKTSQFVYLLHRGLEENEAT